MTKFNEMKTVEITVAEYIELLKEEARIEFLQEYVETENFVSRADIFKILRFENKENKEV